MQGDYGGISWIIIDIVAVIALGAAIAWASHESLEYRRHRRMSVQGHSATPEEAERGRALGQPRDKSFAGYMLRLAVPVAAALLLSIYLCI